MTAFTAELHAEIRRTWRQMHEHRKQRDHTAGADYWAEREREYLVVLRRLRRDGRGGR